MSGPALVAVPQSEAHADGLSHSCWWRLSFRYPAIGTCGSMPEHTASDPALVAVLKSEADADGIFHSCSKLVRRDADHVDCHTGELQVCDTVPPGVRPAAR